WSCHADLSNGTSVDSCVELTNTFGADRATRFFKTVSTGPYIGQCSCEATGAPPSPGFAEDRGYLCLDRATDTVIHGKASRRRLSGELFNVGATVRGTFPCRPDPACDVQPVVDPDLAPLGGSLSIFGDGGVEQKDVAAGGTIDIGYLGPGCVGFASEAPT